MSALFGPAPHLQTVGGFTAFKISMTLIVLGAVWGLLTSTRLLRGEEDAGRWDLLLAGLTTRRSAAAQAIGGLGVGALTLWVTTAIITVLSGQGSKVRISATSSLYFALAMVATAVMFLAVGAVTSQLAATRRQAASIAAALLGVSYALRLIADAGVGFHGLIWASPLGWVEELQPLTSPQPLAFLPIVGFSTLLAIGAVYARRPAGRRKEHRAGPGTRTGPSPTALRSNGARHPNAAGQCHRLVGVDLLVRTSLRAHRQVRWRDTLRFEQGGLFQARSNGDRRQRRARRVLPHPRASSSPSSPPARSPPLAPKSPTERLDHILTRPVSRTSWLGGRLSVAFFFLFVSGVAAALFTWLGTTSQHAGVNLTTLLGAGINLVPPAIVILGFGVLVFGIRPRLTSIAVYGLLGWSLLIVIVGGIGAINHWVLDISIFHHMASAPAVPPNWEANGIMTVIGLTSALVGGFAFSRRDIQGE